MGLALKGNDNFKQQPKEMHGKAKLVKAQKTLTFSATQEEPPKKATSDNEKI